MNRPDIFQRMGLYPPATGAPATLGLEVAGEVVEPAGRWRVGDAVRALLGGGAYAEYAVCNPRHALPIPSGLSFEQAAGLPEAVFTVYANVFEQGALRAGETLLVHGATSGIGIAAIQMGKAAGARVICTARSAAKARFGAAIGADLAIDASLDDFAAIVKAAEGADVVLDMAGGDYFVKNLDILKPGGRIVFIAALRGNEVILPIMQLMQKRAVVTGSTMRSRDPDEKARLAKAVEHRVWPWIETGRVSLPIDHVFPLDRAADAHRLMESGLHKGKIILVPNWAG